MLVWNKELWIIDHGASLYFHFSPENWEKKAEAPFTQIKNHVLLPFASRLEEADEHFQTVLSAEKLGHIVSLIPSDWLSDNFPNAEQAREMYFRFLQIRLASSKNFIKEAQHARAALI